MPDLCETNFHKIRLFDECNEIFCENAFTKNVALYRALKCSGILTPCTGRVFNIKTLPVFFIRRLDMNEKNKAWLCLLCAGLSEVIWAYTMKLSCVSVEIYVYKDGKVY